MSLTAAQLGARALTLREVALALADYDPTTAALLVGAVGAQLTAPSDRPAYAPPPSDDRPPWEDPPPPKTAPAPKTAPKPRPQAPLQGVCRECGGQTALNPKTGTTYAVCYDCLPTCPVCEDAKRLPRGKSGYWPTCFPCKDAAD